MKNILFKYKMIFGTVALAVTMVFLFQNCSEVTLEKRSQVSVFSNGVQGSFCTGATGSSQPFQLKYFFAYNLTARLDLDQLTAVPDSDMDGISDVQETGRLDYDFNPLNRRTYGRLDGLCEGLSQAQCTITPSPAAVGPGLILTDLQGFSFSGLRGVDSDRDSILDILEILSFSDLGISDDLAHLDSDLVPNYREIQQGRNTRDGRDANLPSQNLVSAQATIVPSSDCGGGNSSYTFVINNMPLVNTASFTADAFENELTHNGGDNVILVTYTVESASEKQIYGKYIKINYHNPRGYNLNPNDFALLGSY